MRRSRPSNIAGRALGIRGGLLGVGLARAITIGSIVLTVGSLALAVISARKRSRIRAGFDAARAAIGVVAILVMAAVTGVATPVLAVLAAIAVGLGIGFAQGNALDVSAGDGGFYAKRSPLGIGLWGLGIVIMQTAGIMARTGTVQLGQTIAWFSVCLGIGLMTGRNRPLQTARRSLAGTGVAVLIGLLLLPAAALLSETANPASAQTGGVGNDDLPFPWTYEGTLVRTETWTAEFGAGASVTSVNEDDLVITLLADGTVEGTWTRYREDVAVFECEDPDKAGQIYIRSFEPEVFQISGWTHGGGVITRPNNLPPGSYDAAAMAVSRSYESTISPDGCLGGTFTLQANEVAIIPRVAPPAGEIATPATAAPPLTTAPPATTASPPTATSITTAPPTTAGVPPNTEPAIDRDEPADAAAPIESGDDEIEPDQAAAQAIVGLVAAAAIGLISMAEAAAGVNLVQTSRVVDGVAPAASAGSSAAADTGRPAAVGPVRTTTIYVTGSAAEAVLAGGPGTDVSIPEEQRWGENVSSEGESVQRDDYGTTGRVRSIGPVVRGPDGQLSVAVEVDAFTPPPPDIPIQPISTPGDEPPPVPSRPPQPSDVAPDPTDEGEGFTPEEVDQALDRGLDDLGELPDLGSDAPVPPPDLEPEAPGDAGGPPTGDDVTPGPPVEETPVEETPVTEDEAEIGPESLDEGTPGDAAIEPGAEQPETPDGVVMSRQEIDDIVRWGRENNRPLEDIQRDLDSENERRGGSGTVSMPEDLEQVETPNGPVILTAAEARAYRDALAEIERAPEWQRRLQDRLADLSAQAREWTDWQMRPELRAVAGIQELLDRQSSFQAEQDRLLDELERLNSPPSRIGFDVGAYSSYDEAQRDWEQRGTAGIRHDAIADTEARLQELRENYATQMRGANPLGDVPLRLSRARGALAGIEEGLAPPIGAEYESDAAYQQAVSDWATRDTEGQFFDEAQRLRTEIQALEAATRTLQIQPPGLTPPAPYLPQVEPTGVGDPAVGTPYSTPDEGTMFDRPARNLERIAQQQDRFLELYRNNHQRLADARNLIEDINSRASSE